VKPRLTPVHCFTIRNQHGHTRWLLVNGGYCDGPARRTVEAQHPGWTVTDQTWRADWTQLALPSNSEPGYQAGQGAPTPSQPPWQAQPDTAPISAIT
jgi:hypothetical protein